MVHAAASAPAFTVLDLPAGERNLIGLARVSTDAQDAQLQQDALALAGCARIYIEKISTRKAATDRPGLVAALDYLRRGDTLVACELRPDDFAVLERLLKRPGVDTLCVDGYATAPDRIRTPCPIRPRACDACARERR